MTLLTLSWSEFHNDLRRFICHQKYMNRNNQISSDCLAKFMPLCSRRNLWISDKTRHIQQYIVFSTFSIFLATFSQELQDFRFFAIYDCLTKFMPSCSHRNIWISDKTDHIQCIVFNPSREECSELFSGCFLALLTCFTPLSSLLFCQGDIIIIEGTITPQESANYSLLKDFSRFTLTTMG